MPATSAVTLAGLGLAALLLLLRASRDPRVLAALRNSDPAPCPPLAN
ncbi:hypothetical protein ACU4GD_12220 [Cupriavidus basilensis]